MSILNDCEDERSSRSCGDPQQNEVRMFTKQERIEIQKSVEDDTPEEDIDGHMLSCEYVQYLISKIKKAKRKYNGKTL